jgi:hypothetical protein
MRLATTIGGTSSAQCAVRGAHGRGRSLSVRCDARARAAGREKGDDADDFGQVVEDAPSSISRRFIALAALTSTTRAAFAAPIPYGLYAPPPPSSSASAGGTKTKKTKTTAERYVDTLTDDLANKRYFFTGDLTTEIFADECRFIDPTTNVKGVERYLRAVRVLFDDSRSSVRLLAPLRLTSPTTIEGDYVAEGYLKLPWNPKVPAYEGHIVWTIAPDDGSPSAGLIVEQRQTWSVSGNKALLETFTPSVR